MVTYSVNSNLNNQRLVKMIIQKGDKQTDERGQKLLAKIMRFPKFSVAITALLC